ncbi:uncharacterized protein LOC131634461 [Vicia villosa]|uniref:uncharacterized protein LOC131634461 n=1 Tax=Vicia villosa TaxID=3911 RepID=UPI00273B5829|nr:uncharacterized protein LOC131634461 [Vicia villosa]
MEELCAKGLFAIFKGYGLMLEVAIPPKRDNKGSRYGFVRFRKVNNERELAIKLDNIFISERKLYANIPRFNRVRKDYVKVDQVGVDAKGVAEVTYKEDGYREDDKNNKARRGETSYVNMVKGNMGNDIRFMEGQGKNIKAQEKERNILWWCGREKMSRFAHLQINIEEAEMSRFEKAYVGVVETSGITYNIQEAFHTEGYFKVKATPLGVNLCLLEKHEEGETKALIEEAKDWVGQLFSDIHPWSPGDVDNERLTWMRGYELPCHAWYPKVFEFISSLVGIYVCSDDETREHKRMDVARFLVRTKYSLVLNETINVEINDQVYQIKLVKDMHGPKRIIVPNECNKDDPSEDSNSEEKDGEDSAWNEKEEHESEG